MKKILSILLFALAFTSFAQDEDMGGPMASNYSYNKEAQSYLIRYTTFPAVIDANQINRLVVGLKSDLAISTLSANFDIFYILANSVQQAAKFNLVNSSYTITEINSPGWVAFQGYSSNGTSSYENTNWNPSANGNVYSSFGGSIGLYSRTDNTGTKQDGGCNASAPFGFGLIQPRETSTNYFAAGVNSNVADFIATQTAVGDSYGLFSVCRNPSTTVTTYKRAAQIKQVTGSTADARPNVTFTINARNVAGSVDNFDNREYAFFFTGIGFNSDNIRDIYNRMQTYLTFYGTQK